MISKRICIDRAPRERLDIRTMRWTTFFKLLKSAEIVTVTSIPGTGSQALLRRTETLKEPQKRRKRSRSMMGMRKKKEKRRKNRRMTKKKRERTKKRKATTRIWRRMSERTEQVIL